MTHKKNKPPQFDQSASVKPIRKGSSDPIRAGHPSSESLRTVLKCDSAGSLEAVTTALMQIEEAGQTVQIVQGDLGPVNKSDLLMAESADRLIIGFQVGVQPKIERLSQQQGIEIRLYEIIYNVTRDLRSIMRKRTVSEPRERIFGKAKVIALFKGGRHGIIIGLEVTDGRFLLGKPFRLISAMGPVYSGTVESMQIDKKPAKEAHHGQQVGIKIEGFREAHEGDLVECFEAAGRPERAKWHPRGGVLRYAPDQ